MRTNERPNERGERKLSGVSIAAAAKSNPLPARDDVMSNLEIIQQFESGAVAPESFHHADHVRLAFAYLSEYPPLAALEKFAAAIKRFALSVGKPDRYNETITFAYLFLIRQEMARSGRSDWEEFSRNHPELLGWKDGVLSRYYQPETLQSDLARKTFIFPDKCI